MSNSDQKKEKRMSFLEHTAELLTRLRMVILSIVVTGFFVAFWPLNIRELFSSAFNPFTLSAEYKPLVSLLMRYMTEHLLPEDASLIAGGLMDTAYIYLMVSVLIGCVLSSPLIAYQLYKFFGPALIKQERRYASYVMIAFVGLFISGGYLAYSVILPITFRILMWFIRSAAALPLINVKDFVMMVVTLILGVALLYTSPIFLVLLVDRGVLSAKHLTENRKMVYAAFIIITAIVTPDPTIVSDVILIIPFIFIFEATILISKRAERKRIEREKNLEKNQSS